MFSASLRTGTTTERVGVIAFSYPASEMARVAGTDRGYSLFNFGPVRADGRRARGDPATGPGFTEAGDSCPRALCPTARNPSPWRGPAPPARRAPCPAPALIAGRETAKFLAIRRGPGRGTPYGARDPPAGISGRTMKPVHFLILSIALALLFTLFPGVDRAASRLFYDPAGGFFLKDWGPGAALLPFRPAAGLHAARAAGGTGGDPAAAGSGAGPLAPRAGRSSPTSRSRSHRDRAS